MILLISWLYPMCVYIIFLVNFMQFFYVNFSWNFFGWFQFYFLLYSLNAFLNHFLHFYKSYVILLCVLFKFDVENISILHPGFAFHTFLASFDVHSSFLLCIYMCFLLLTHTFTHTVYTHIVIHLKWITGMIFSPHQPHIQTLLSVIVKLSLLSI